MGRIALVEDVNAKYPIVVADSHVTVIRPIHNFIDTKYLLSWFSSPCVQNEIVEKSSGSTNQIELATSTIKNYCVPIPPLAEQQRIVAKIDELMALCEQLKNIDPDSALPLADMQDILPSLEIPPRLEQKEQYAMAARGELPEEMPGSLNAAISNMFQRKKNA